jgi:type IV pilus assembly protein PilE
MRRTGGFTLIELLIAVMLVAILAAIAIPSYSAYVKRGQRAAAKAALEQAAQFLERNYTSYGCYNFVTVADCAAQPGAPTVVLPITGAPNDGGQPTYAIALAAAPAGLPGQTFSVSATPCGSGGGCPNTSNQTFTDPDCGVLSLDNTGLKSAGVAANTATCWQR